MIRGPGGDGRVAVVALADVADAVAAVLRDLAPHADAVYSLTGPQALSLAEIAAVPAAPRTERRAARLAPGSAVPGCRTMRFGSQRPPAQAVRWVENALGGTARVVAWRAMTGGITSAVHRLTIDYGTGRTGVLVLRRYERKADAPARAETAAVRDEAATLRAVHDARLPAPEPVAADADGCDTGGQPAILMTRVPGSLDLTPASPQRWLGQMAAMAARIHDLPVAAPPLRGRVDAAAPVVPASAVRPALWEAAFGILRQQPPQAGASFLHGDYQHFNLLWRRGQLSGVVDWAMAGTGPADVDTGHCRLNLAVLFGPETAEQFRLAYEAEAGRVTDPWWDLYAVTAYSERVAPLHPGAGRRARAGRCGRDDRPGRAAAGADRAPRLI